MNYTIKGLPDRTVKPRDKGLTMVMDKGLSLSEAGNFIEMASEYTDLVKLGWGTSYLTPNLDAKLKLYRDAELPVYFGGTLFEVFISRGQFDDYCRLLDKYQLQYAEVSDGSINIPHEHKCEYIA
ncbi:MAG: phosphosulfolactate synthase, partial [Sphingobacteriales bacterium]